MAHKIRRSNIVSLIQFGYYSTQGPDVVCESRLEGVNRAKLKFTKLITTTSRVSVRNINESAREGAKQIASE
jgi:hypothetical protein